jgi:DNA mismatch endonuclease (patch repair protein)
MAEKISPETRSRMMAGIRGGNTKPELLVRRHLHRAGFRFRLFAKDLPGRPDVVLPKWNTLVLVHGCFWHGHRGCRYFRLPKTRPEWWAAKIDANAARDARSEQLLVDAGWRVAVVWECALRLHPDQTLAALEAFIRSNAPAAEFAEDPFKSEPRGSPRQFAGPDRAGRHYPPACAD